MRLQAVTAGSEVRFRPDSNRIAEIMAGPSGAKRGPSPARSPETFSESPWSPSTSRDDRAGGRGQSLSESLSQQDCEVRPESARPRAFRVIKLPSFVSFRLSSLLFF